MKVYTRVLKNGLRVIVAPRKNLESVAIVVGVNFGSMDEGERMNGLAHLIEHMLFKGTTKRSWADINEITRSYSIYYNAETDYETTFYEAVVYRRYFEKAMDLISDMVINPVFDRKELERERGPILHEVAIRREDPDSILYDNMPRTLFREDSILMPPDSSALSGRIKKKDLVKAYYRYYNPENMAVVIYGGIESAKAFELANKYMSRFRRKHYAPERHLLERRGRTNRIYVRKKDIERGEIGIAIACRGISSGSMEEYVAMDAVAELLNNRIYDKVREEHGLSYDPSVDYEPYSTFGYIMASAGAEPSKIGRIRSIIFGELERIGKEGIGKIELAEAKKGLAIKYAMGLDHALDSATEIAEMELMYGSGKMMESLPLILDKLDAQTLKRFIKEYINTSRYGEIVLKKAVD